MHLWGGTADTPNRAVVPGVLRSRWMAPVYALVISFLAVLLLGAVAKPASPVQVQLTTTEQGRTVPATALKGTRVKVLVGNGTDVEVKDNGQFDAVTSGDSLTICVQLPQGWSAPNTTPLPNGYSCWTKDRSQVNADGWIELLVTRGGNP